MILITEFLSKKDVLLIKTKNRLSAIKELLDFVTEKLGWRERLNLLEGLMDREEFQSTAVLRGVAIPHLRTGLVPNLRLALGISKEGIDFRANDGQLTNFIFLILLPYDQEELYLSLLSHVMELFSDKQLMLDLSVACSPKEIWELLAIAEDRYPLLPCYAGGNIVNIEWS